ncbi:hypothetical protein RJ55_03320 [Drechmeria coniospora]|nr:hypothetical protein RJ55_03320 [Drechmeria coniospora]
MMASQMEKRRRGSFAEVYANDSPRPRPPHRRRRGSQANDSALFYALLPSGRCNIPDDSTYDTTRHDTTRHDTTPLVPALLACLPGGVYVGHYRTHDITAARERHLLALE